MHTKLHVNINKYFITAYLIFFLQKIFILLAIIRHSYIYVSFYFYYFKYGGMSWINQ